MNFVRFIIAALCHTIQNQRDTPDCCNSHRRKQSPVDQVHERLVAHEERLVVLQLEQQSSGRTALPLGVEVGVEVSLAVLTQHLVHAHDQTRVEEVEAGVGLHVAEHADQSYEVGADDAG